MSEGNIQFCLKKNPLFKNVSDSELRYSCRYLMVVDGKEYYLHSSFTVWRMVQLYKDIKIDL